MVMKALGALMEPVEEDNDVFELLANPTMAQIHEHRRVVRQKEIIQGDFHMETQNSRGGNGRAKNMKDLTSNKMSLFVLVYIAKRQTILKEDVGGDLMSEITNILWKYKKLVENQSGCNMRIIRSNNGKEYANDTFDKFCEEVGIKHQFTLPYTKTTWCK
ncbi:hypothetical protein CR513_15902, partial [Mucuna pruriens]